VDEHLKSEGSGWFTLAFVTDFSAWQPFGILD